MPASIPRPKPESGENDLEQSLQRRAIIIGGSMGGLFAALMLRRHGWDVEVFERTATRLESRGAGIVTHPRLWTLLARLGIDPHQDFGVTVQERVTLAPDGAVVGTRLYPQLMTSWDRLYRLLRAALPDRCYTQGAELTGIEVRDGGVRAHFAGGTQSDGTLLVGADGVRSTVRQLLVGDVPLAYAGYIAWRGLVNEAEMPPKCRATLFERFAFCLPPGEQMLGYPIAGENNDLRPGHRRYNFVWYRPAEEATDLPDLLTDATGHRHGFSIPPPLIRPGVVAAMRDAADSLLAPAFAQVVAATAQPFLQPIYDLETPRMAWPRAVLLGDSAFVVRPHVGAGVTKAAEDAACLADSLEATPDVPAALARYEADRKAAGTLVVRRARYLGAYLQPHLATEEQRAAAARHRTPEAVMKETASMDF